MTETKPERTSLTVEATTFTHQEGKSLIWIGLADVFDNDRGVVEDFEAEDVWGLTSMIEARDYLTAAIERVKVLEVTRDFG